MHKTNWPRRALGLALMLLVVGVGVASADQQAFLMGGGPANSALVRSNWSFPPCGTVKRSSRSPFPSPSTYPWFFVVSAAGSQTGQQNYLTIPGSVNGTPAAPVVCNDGDPYARIIFDASIPNATTIIVNPTNTGNSIPGGLGVLTVGDSTFARDSVKISVARAGTSVTINNFVGFMRNTLGSVSKMPARNTLILAVYPDTTSALADSNLTGAGAAFYGKVVLSKARGVDQIAASGGFNSADFVIKSGTVQNEAVPAGGLSKVVSVPNGANATIVLSADPVVGVGTGIPEGLPGSSPVGLGLISLLLLGGGTWVISRQYRRNAA